MKLNVRECGTGDRLAVLIHGFNCDSGDWWQVAPALVDLGYRVQAVDLRGHGKSDRADRYRVADFASDLVETVMERPEVMIGHSLGALVAGVAMPQLFARRAIYLDPPWSALDESSKQGLFPDLESIAKLSDDELEAVLRVDFPRWSDQAIAADLASWRLWDPRTAEWIEETGVASVPHEAAVPSLLVVADPSEVCREAEQSLAAQRGFVVVEATGLSHSLFRDDFEQFMRALDGWL